MKALYPILLLIWLIGGTLLCRKNFCGTKAKAKPTAAKAVGAAAGATKGGCDRTLVFKDGDLNLVSNYNFTFKPNSSVISPMPSDALSSVLEKVAEHLADNTDKALLIEGHYYKNEAEKKPIGFENMGLARAGSIKTLLTEKYNIAEEQIRTGSSIITGCINKKSKILTKGATTSFGDL